MRYWCREEMRRCAKFWDAYILQKGRQVQRHSRQFSRDSGVKARPILPPGQLLGKFFLSPSVVLVLFRVDRIHTLATRLPCESRHTGSPRVLSEAIHAERTIPKLPVPATTCALHRAPRTLTSFMLAFFLYPRTLSHRPLSLE